MPYITVGRDKVNLLDFPAARVAKATNALYRMRDNGIDSITIRPFEATMRILASWDVACLEYRYDGERWVEEWRVFGA